MPVPPRNAALLGALLALPPAAAAGAAEPRAVSPAASALEIDGALTDEAWAHALRLELAFEVRPGENVPPPVRTEMFITFDESHLLLGFRCHDPEPSAIRARYSDRDRAWDDDWVGVVLDTFNDERRAYEIFVNPLGVQMDAINDDLAGAYDSEWDAIWESAGRVTGAGYEVEMAIPFNQLRFDVGPPVQIWGIDGVRSYPRRDRHHIGLFPRIRGQNSYLSQTEKIQFTDFDAVRPGRNLEIAPTVTALRTDVRRDPPAGPLERLASDGELGATLRWGVTPNLTVGATANPDFSQVEADAVQFDVNNQFALFFSETRPFFLEGADIFNVRGVRLLHTRTVSDPHGAGKLTGKIGRHTVGVFTARDAVTSVLVPGSQGSQTGTFDLDTAATAARYRFDIGANSSVGVMATDRRGGAYFNRAVGLDTRHRVTASDSISLTVSRSTTQYSDEMRDRFEEDEGARSDVGLYAAYGHSVRNWYANACYSDFGDDFRADMGFVSQVGYRRWEGAGGYILHGRSGLAFNRIEFSGNYDQTEEPGGALIEREYEGYVNYQGPAESSIDVGGGYRDRTFDGVTFEQRFYNVSGSARPSAMLRAGFSMQWGDWIDFVHARAARQRNIRPSATLNLGRHLLVSASHIFNVLDVDGGRLFTAHIPEVRTVYQVNTRALVRVILQYTDIQRTTALYASSDTEAHSRDVFSQWLFSYTVNPQTVLYMGYADSYEGAAAFGLTRTERSFFLKVGYAWLP